MKKIILIILIGFNELLFSCSKSDLEVVVDENIFTCYEQSWSGKCIQYYAYKKEMEKRSLNPLSFEDYFKLMIFLAL